MKFKNPANQYIEEPPYLAPVWTLLFGFLYLAIKGLWAHVFIYIFLLIATNVLFYEPFSWLLVVSIWIGYAVSVNGLLETKYKRNGWVEVPEENISTSKTSSMIDPYTSRFFNEVRDFLQKSKRLSVSYTLVSTWYSDPKALLFDESNRKLFMVTKKSGILKGVIIDSDELMRVELLGKSGLLKQSFSKKFYPDRGEELILNDGVNEIDLNIFTSSNDEIRMLKIWYSNSGIEEFFQIFIDKKSMTDMFVPEYKGIAVFWYELICKMFDTSQIISIDTIQNGNSSSKDDFLKSTKSNYPYDELEKLANLKQKGILTDEEFTQQKEKLLNSL